MDTPIDQTLIEHYRLHMKIYGQLIVELADHDSEIIKLINGGDELGALMSGLKELIRATCY